MFKRHFGFNFEDLNAGWREWVREQGIGTFTPLRPFIRDGLLCRVIPLIEDRQAKREDRILAIRDMGIRGYAVGGDVLIALLGSDGSIPREELVWALEAISGIAHGDDQDRWWAWWNSLPTEIREAKGRAQRSNRPGPGRDRGRAASMKQVSGYSPSRNHGSPLRMAGSSSSAARAGNRFQSPNISVISGTDGKLMWKTACPATAQCLKLTTKFSRRRVLYSVLKRNVMIRRD